MSGQSSFEALEKIRRRIRLCDYLVVAQLFLQDNFLMERELVFDDVKPRLLGHWGTCHGINVAYANLKAHFGDDPNFSFILGPGHGFPALNANLWLDGELAKVDTKATRDAKGLAYLCKQFSWPDGFPSHASPLTPGIITEGGELGYALANAYGLSLGHPEKITAVLIGDGELETATALDSLNLRGLLTSEDNGRILPILHLNGYKISAPSLSLFVPRFDDSVEYARGESVVRARVEAGRVVHPVDQYHVIRLRRRLQPARRRRRWRCRRSCTSIIPQPSASPRHPAGPGCRPCPPRRGRR